MTQIKQNVLIDDLLTSGWFSCEEHLYMLTRNYLYANTKWNPWVLYCL